MLARILRRPFVAGAAQAQRTRAGLADFFEAGRNPNQDSNITYGRSWKAEELLHKSWEDLHQLWYVSLKEKNMLLSQKQMLLSQNMRMPNPERFPKVRRTMCRIKQVLTERALAEPAPSQQKSLRKMSLLLRASTTGVVKWGAVNPVWRVPFLSFECATGNRPASRTTPAQPRLPQETGRFPGPPSSCDAATMPRSKLRHA